MTYPTSTPILIFVRHKPYQNKEIDMNYKMAETKVRVKGLPTAVYANGNQVHIWIASPTGDSSDSFQYSIPCLSETQAEQVATEWNNLLSK